MGVAMDIVRQGYGRLCFGMVPPKIFSFRGRHFVDIFAVHKMGALKGSAII
jgi:hypothetical protein